MAREHVAIVQRSVAAALLAGLKTVETRFSRQRRTPIGRVGVGDVIHFKISGGDFIGTAAARHVSELPNLSATAMLDLRRRFGVFVCAPERYWASRTLSRYGVLIWLGPVKPPPRRLSLPRQYGSGWVVLGES